MSVSEVPTKRLELFHALVPKAVRVAMLVNPENVPIAERMLHDVPQAARAFGLQMQMLNASTENEIEAAFDTLVRDRIDALFVTPDTYFISQRDQLAALTARYRIPATFPLAKRPKLAG
jgi:putative ABC transport system substrate-binding protein